MTARKPDVDSLFGEVISSYSRAQALSDGALVDVSEAAREAGIKFPCAVTRAVWSGFVEVPKGVSGQDAAGRLWDVVWMLRVAIGKGADGSVVRYQLYVRNSDRRQLDRRDLVTLKAVCGPGDDASPVVTIMMPEED